MGWRAASYVRATQRLPEAHGSFLLRALPVLQAEPSVQAVIVSGSALTGNMDEWSDLDLVVLVDDAAERTFTGQHFAVVQRLGTLLTAHRADHFGGYMGTKLGRGELFEAMASLEFFRARFVVPLITIEAGRAPRGPRRLEETGSPRLGDLRRTYCPCDRGGS